MTISLIKNLVVIELSQSLQDERWRGSGIFKAAASLEGERQVPAKLIPFSLTAALIHFLSVA